VSGSGISWAVCKSAPCSRQITMPAPHHPVFYGPDALPAAQPTVSKHWRHQCHRQFSIYPNADLFTDLVHGVGAHEVDVSHAVTSCTQLCLFNLLRSLRQLQRFLIATCLTTATYRRPSLLNTLRFNDLSYDYLKFTVWSSYDSDLQCAKISLRNITS